MNTLPKYYVFGSPSSKDLDIIVFVDSIPPTHEAKKLCHSFKDLYQPFFTKEVNANIGVLDNGVMTKVFKGSLDEVNNSLIDTYFFHEQKHPLLIEQRIARDVENKILRSVRIVLSTLSRSQHRVIVKASLQGNLIERISALSNINLSEALKDIKYPIEDIYKTISFQMGQTLGLINGIELYTKEDVGLTFPELNPFLMREENLNLLDLEKIKLIFVNSVNDYLPRMKNLEEKL